MLGPTCTGANADRAAVGRNPRAFLITTTTRICLDVLRSARFQRDGPLQPWLPSRSRTPTALAPDTQTELAEDLTVALMLALERLSPLERAAFLLHDVLRLLVHAGGRAHSAARRRRAGAAGEPGAGAGARGGRRVRLPARPASSSVDPKHAELISAFLTASRAGDFAALTRLLASDIRLVADSGGKALAPLNVLEGADRVAAFFGNVVRKGLTADMIYRVRVIERPARANPEGAAVESRRQPSRSSTAWSRRSTSCRTPTNFRHLASAWESAEGGRGCCSRPCACPEPEPRRCPWRRSSPRILSRRRWTAGTPCDARGRTRPGHVAQGRDPPVQRQGPDRLDAGRAQHDADPEGAAQLRGPQRHAGQPRASRRGTSSPTPATTTAGSRSVPFRQGGESVVLIHASTPRVLYKMFPRSIEVQVVERQRRNFWVIHEDVEVRRHGEAASARGGAESGARPRVMPAAS